MEKKEFLRQLSLILVEKGVDSAVADEQIKRIDGYLTQNGEVNVDVNPADMADGIIGMLDAEAAAEKENISASLSDKGESIPTKAETEQTFSAASAVGVRNITENEKDDAVNEISIDFPFGPSDGKTPEAAVSAEEEFSVALAMLEKHNREIKAAAREKHNSSAEAAPVHSEEKNENVKAEENDVDVEDEDADMRIAPVPGKSKIVSSRDTDDSGKDEEEIEVFPAPDDYSDDKIDRYSPAEHRAKERKQAELAQEKADAHANEKLPSKGAFWTMFCIALPFVAVLAVAMIAVYIGLWIALAVLMIGCVVGLIAFVAVGALISMVGIVYGAIQLIKGIVPVGLFEIGLGIIVGAVVLFVGIIIYNIAIRFIPFAMKQLTRLLKFACTKGQEFITKVKGVAEKL
ncbi:MAG: DUF1700 domain-containing protein [Clostridia bacterium]|nr:DUF1700 domain-containing protein [Clostridia bacterium]